MRPDWKVSFITLFCVFQYAYAPLTFDLDPVSGWHRAGYLSADVGKTIDCVLTSPFTDSNKTHLCCKFWLLSLDMKPFDWFERYLRPKMVFKMSQEYPTASLDITEDFRILHSAYVYICYWILKANTYNWLHTHTHTHTQTTTNKKQLGTSRRLIMVTWMAQTLSCAKFRPLRVIKKKRKRRDNFADIELAVGTPAGFI